MGVATDLDVTPAPPSLEVDAIAAKPEDEKESIEVPVEEKKIHHEESITKEEKPVISADRDVSPPLSVVEDAPPAFAEESYYAKDLKNSEKKALQELKAKIKEAIESNTFLAPPKAAVVAAPREVEVGKEGEEEKKVEKKEAEEGKDGAEVLKEEGAADVAVVVTDESIVAEEEKGAPILSGEAKADAPPDPSVETEESSVSASETEPAEATSRDIPMEVDDSPSLEDLALWGVPLLHSKGDERTDVVLLKFLRARDFKVNDAMSMLKETVIWRKEFETDNLVTEEIATEYDSVAYMYGADKEGHPVCYNHYGVFQDKELYQKTFGDEAQFKRFLRWRIQMLEKGIEKLDFNPSGVHSIVQITDLKDSPGLVKRRNITKKVFTLLQDNYPELVAKQIFINVPWYFGALYSLHGKIVTPRSKSKVVVARSEKVTETLFKYISPENVPLRYGGLSRPNDTEFENVEAPVKEVIVKAGENHTIEIPVEEGGKTVVWDIVVAGWDVVYGEEFVPSVENTYTIIIQKAKKVAATEEPMRNSFKATGPGKVVLTIDNTSRRKRLVAYRHLIKRESTKDC